MLIKVLIYQMILAMLKQSFQPKMQKQLYATMVEYFRGVYLARVEMHQLIYLVLLIFREMKKHLLVFIIMAILYVGAMQTPVVQHL